MSFAAFFVPGIMHCSNGTLRVPVKIARETLDIPLDSANWNCHLAMRYYDKALIRLLDDSLIRRNEGEEIDRQHLHLWDQDSCKFKEYVFLMADAVNHQ